jgi:glycosyltransferase involved in cell wall biosynthesis
MNKQKVLIVSSISPLITDSGGATRIHNTLKYQSQHFEIYFIYFINPGYQLTERDKTFLKKYTKYSYAVKLNGWKKQSSFIDDFQPYWFSDWMNNELKILVSKLIRKYTIPLVQIECTQLSYLLPYIPKGVKKVLVAYDISTISFLRRLKEVHFSIHKIIHFFRFLEIYLYERKYLPLFDYVITVSDTDIQYLKKYFKKAKGLVVPNGIESVVVKKLKSYANKKLTLGYIGSFSHPPNKFAVNYFLNNIAKSISAKGVKFDYLLAGSINRDEVENMVSKAKIGNRNCIKILGFVNETSDFFNSIDLLVAPIFSGSGTRVKIVESLSCGTPVLTTSVGAEGLETINSNYLLLANNTSEFVEGIAGGKWRDLGQKDQSYLEKTMKGFLWENIFNNYAKLVQEKLLKS